MQPTHLHIWLTVDLLIHLLSGALQIVIATSHIERNWEGTWAPFWCDLRYP
jgi:hypothetical protein